MKRVDPIDERRSQMMTAPKTARATVLVEWSANGHQGILVHADRYRDTWILPGGGLEQYKNGRWELPLAAAVRELAEETELIAEEVKTLFVHQGSYREHHVFQIRAAGTLDKIIDSKEAPAFAICGPDLKPHVFLCEAGFATAGLVVSASTKAILKRYYQSKTSQAPIQVKVGAAILELTDGNIVTQDVDAVVNAANKHLANGNGVCGAIFKAAGAEKLTAACQKIGGCPVGEARITKGFELTARHIIHAVGPKYGDYRPEQADTLLVGAYRFSLELASKHGLHSVAFPSISTGIFGFPPERAAPLVLQAVIDYLRDHQEITLVRFVLWTDNLAIYSKALRKLMGA